MTRDSAGGRRPPGPTGDQPTAAVRTGDEGTPDLEPTAAVRTGDEATPDLEPTVGVDGDLARELLRLESALARRDPAGIAGGLGALIAGDFLEFGRSGRVYDAGSARELLAANAPAPVAFAPSSFAVDELAPHVVLVTYDIGTERKTHRSSIWVRRDGRWLMRFHQGTPTETD